MAGESSGLGDTNNFEAASAGFGPTRRPVGRTGPLPASARDGRHPPAGQPRLRAVFTPRRAAGTLALCTREASVRLCPGKGPAGGRTTSDVGRRAFPGATLPFSFLLAVRYSVLRCDASAKRSDLGDAFLLLLWS